MENKELEAILQQSLEPQEVYVSGDGSHFQLIVVSEQFHEMRRLKREQMVYAPLMSYIADNSIHAVNIRTFTPDEWQRDRKLNGF